MKAMVIAHAHPDFSVGGAEIAAYNLFRTLKARHGYGESIFLARSDLPSQAHGSITMRRPGEYLWRQDIGDWFRLQTQNPMAVMGVFREVLKAERPDLAFLHHYVHIGVEILREIKLTLPDCLLIVTLHEYVAICNRNGQMVKNNSKKLCYRESLEDCSNCFPERTPQDFWLRKHYIQKNFEYADAFVAPSQFLRQRYIDWGIPEEHIVVIENGQPTPHAPKAGPASARLRARFGFFGQITEYKGVEVLLQAIHLISKEIRAKMIFEIHGANLEVAGAMVPGADRHVEKAADRRGGLALGGSLRTDGARAADEQGRLGDRPVDLVGEFSPGHPGGIRQRQARHLRRDRRDGGKGARWRRRPAFRGAKPARSRRDDDTGGKRAKPLGQSNRERPETVVARAMRRRLSRIGSLNRVSRAICYGPILSCLIFISQSALPWTIGRESGS